MPAKINHMMLKKVYKQPDATSSFLNSTPKGARLTKANLKH
jgi:hypothetical protein